jgi:SagB-type dehydrogenase family enzyme
VDQDAWQKILLPPGNEEQTWELYHENSKIGRFDGALSDEEVRKRSKEFHESLPFIGYPKVTLPEHVTPLAQRLDDTLIARVSTRDLVPSTLTLETLGTLLFYGYGDTRANKDGRYPRPFRVVPSGGALYPLELFFHSASLHGADAGIYHYNPPCKDIRLVVRGDQTNSISKSMIYSEITQNSSLVIFITAMFERSVFKYGDRGYRFTLLEAGHVAQNLNPSQQRWG